MDFNEIESVIASANNLLASLQIDFGDGFGERHANRRSSLTVTSRHRRSHVVSNETGGARATLPSREESIEIIQPPNLRGTPSNRTDMVDIIDLCLDSPESNVRQTRNAQTQSLAEVVNLVSPERIASGNTAHNTKNDEVIRRPGRRTSLPNISAEEPLNTEMICAICMESYISRQPTTTNCGHVFCQSCIVQSFKISHSCPICRKKLNSKMLIRIHL